MHKLLLALSVTPILASLILCAASLKLADACPASNTCELTVPNEVEFDTQSPPEATYTINAKWHCVGTPFLGATEEFSGTINVTNVTYDPAYFFPSTCDTSTGVDITVNCTMSGTCPQPHALNTILNVGPTPNNCSTADVTELVCP